MLDYIMVIFWDWILLGLYICFQLYAEIGCYVNSSLFRLDSGFCLSISIVVHFVGFFFILILYDVHFL